MFSYLRLSALLSLLAIIVIAAFSGIALRNLAVDELVRVAEKNNKSMVQSYVSHVWKQYRDTVVPLSDSDMANLNANPQVIQFAQDTVRYFQHMPFIRVNVYKPSGTLLLKIDVNSVNKLVGAASPDKAFVSKQLAQKTLGSNLLQDATLQNTPTATLIQTLVPIVPEGGDNAIEGMVEVVYDMTDAWNQHVAFQMYGTGGVIAIFLVFSGILFFTSKKTESIIAKQHEANMELAAAATAAQAENREKSQFLANVSHELRTPLNAIIGFSDIIKNEVIASVENHKYHDYINDIHSSGVHLLSLINDILDYSKAEAGKLELEVSEVNANKLVQNSMRLVSPRAETSNVKLVESLPKEQLIMFADGKKLKQILLNLLSNAVKFTPSGGEVKVSAWRDMATDMFIFEVKDTGIGIAPKDISRAMTPFGQVDNTLSRKYEGTGLGLPLTKKFVELMGGKFTIESEMNVGTTVTFTLPRELKEREGLVIKQVA